MNNDIKWQPTKITTCPQYLPQYDKKILKKAFDRYYTKHKRFPLEVLKDSKGRDYGFRCSDRIILAKKEPYGSIISIMEKAVLKAREKQIIIHLWVESNKCFYQIDPYQISMNPENINHRGGEPFINFNIKLLKRVEI